MSNILNQAFAMKGLDFHLEGTLESLTMDNIPTENWIDNGEPKTPTKVRNDYSDASEYNKTEERSTVTTEAATICRLL